MIGCDRLLPNHAVVSTLQWECVREGWQRQRPSVGVVSVGGGKFSGAQQLIDAAELLGICQKQGGEAIQVGRFKENTGHIDSSTDTKNSTTIICREQDRVVLLRACINKHTAYLLHCHRPQTMSDTAYY